jgi:hemerythrin-like metal-binding protein
MKIKKLEHRVKYTATHFSAEENLMQSYAYPDYAKHKFIHDSLVKEVIELQASYKAGKSLMSLKVMKFLNNWLVNHIQGEDKKYGPFLN